MTELSREEIEAIKAGCEGVTPGPWELDGYRFDDGSGRYEGYQVLGTQESVSFNVVTDTSNATVAVIHEEDGRRWDEQGRVNMAHIARLSPEAVTVLCDRALQADALERERDEALDALDDADTALDRALKWNEEVQAQLASAEEKVRRARADALEEAAAFAEAYSFDDVFAEAALPKGWAGLRRVLASGLRALSQARGEEAI